MQKVDITLNPIQQTLHDLSYDVKRLYFVAGRGTGKSSYGIGTIIRNIVHFLPKSKWLIIAESYRSMLENTLPSTIKALESFGYYRDIHYVIGIKPPKLWDTPYEPPLKGFKNTITFWNGASFLLVSQDSAATSPRGLNTDGVIVDEALNLDKEHFDEEIIPTVRANQTQFKNVPFHLGQFFFSSMPYSTNAEWLTNNITYYLEDGIDQEKLMNQLIKLQVDFLKEQSVKHKEKLWGEINQLRSTIHWYTKVVDRASTLYLESNAFDNIRVLGYDYIYNLYKTTSEIRFMTEIMNKRMNKPEGGFYAKFDRDVHTYKRFFLDESKGVFDDNHLMNELGDNFNIDKAVAGTSLQDRDCLTFEPLYLSLDFGGNINCAVVGQYLEGYNRFNFIKDFFVKTPDTIDELANNFVDYYKYHQHKVIYMFYDRFGNQEVGNSKMTYAEQFSNIVEGKGFSIVKMTTGLNPKHMDKYLLWAKLLDNKEDTPLVRFNYYNCQDLIYSIEGAELKERNGEWRKDKSNEGKHLETEEREPHLSDAADYVIFNLFRSYLSRQLEYLDNQVR